jgi:hypothetical protein
MTNEREIKLAKLVVKGIIILATLWLVYLDNHGQAADQIQDTSSNHDTTWIKGYSRSEKPDCSGYRVLLKRDLAARAYRDSCHQAFTDSIWIDFVERYWQKTGWSYGARKVRRVGDIIEVEDSELGGDGVMIE